ncbi:MAG TPA: RagB/SusD family nutrient uptake outer membrane protein [Hanamia sp.]|jgi:starch-binding outer membrane protein, SusD/RagB family|nr:RagB/SusD family nutrient uptake outer membrane protein [Hanamia sp.]
MKKFIKIFFAICLILLVVSSCKKSFLQEKIYSNYAPETLTDSLGFEASITGLSNLLSTWFTLDSHQGFIDAWQVGTDVAFATAAEGAEVPFYNYSTLDPTNFVGSFTWTWAYQMINNANNIITNVEKPDIVMGQANKNSIDAEAKFYRAYAYNILATLFGKVPIITQPLAAPKTDFVRSSLDSVNNLIVNDLIFSAANLPDIDNVKSNSKGKMYERPNNAMAQQLLAIVYLRIGKPDLAEAQCNAIINSGKFKLITQRYGVKAGKPGDPYSDMFVYGNQRRNQGNTEAIWILEQENPNTVVGGITQNAQQRRNWGAAYYSVPGMKICDSLGGRGISRMRLSNWVLYGLYADGDMRNSEYNLRRHFYYNDPAPAYASKYGHPVPFDGSIDTIRFIAPHITKWYQFDPNDEFGYAMIKDFVLMRLGETYLLLAESQLKQGKLDEAASSVNVLRQRAFPDYPLHGQVHASDMTMNFILDERVRELIGEENRRMVLMRTNTLVDRAIKLNSNSVQNPLNGLTDKNLLLPIPQSEIDLNKDAKLDQNPGY